MSLSEEYVGVGAIERSVLSIAVADDLDLGRDEPRCAFLLFLFLFRLVLLLLLLLLLLKATVPSIHDEEEEDNTTIMRLTTNHTRQRGGIVVVIETDEEDEQDRIILRSILFGSYCRLLLSLLLIRRIDMLPALGPKLKE